MSGVQRQGADFVTEQQGQPSQNSPPKGIFSRLVHLLLAVGVEGAFSALFFLYLAWFDVNFYGEVMYAVAAGGIIIRVVQYGLYYSLVIDLGGADEFQARKALGRANIIKVALLALCMAFIVGLCMYKAFSSQMSIFVFIVTLGFGLEAFTDTFYAELRVQGRQDKEARIRMAASVISHGYGFATSALGLGPIAIGLFKVVSAALQVVLLAGGRLSNYRRYLSLSSDWQAISRVFSAATVYAVIDILGTIYVNSNIFFLERATGTTGVAFYSATWNLIHAACLLVSEQWLKLVVFPVLSVMWMKNREALGSLIQMNAQWLLAIAMPIMFVLHVESDFIIGLLYRPEYRDAIWMQKYLIWSIPLSFHNNLLSVVMMVAGAAKILAIFQAVATGLNLVFNVALVPSFGLLGACLVLILTRAVMTILTTVYCESRFGFFRKGDFFFPLTLGVGSLGLFLLLEPVAGLHPAVLIAVAVYGLVLWRLGPKLMGSLRSEEVEEAH